MRDYILTMTGKRVYLPGCEPDSIDINDIARALSMAPRFAGHMDRFYSVAEHSVNVSKIVGDDVEIQIQALMHDATEAYLCDIPSPFKPLLTNYKELEADLWRAVCIRFGIREQMYPEVKIADMRMLMTEKDHLKKGSAPFSDYYEEFSRVPFDDIHRNPQSGEAAFLHRFSELMLQRFDK